MAEERIDSLFDRDKITKEAEDLFNAISARLKKFPSIRVNLDGSKTVKEFAEASQLATKEIAALRSENEKLQNQLTKLKSAQSEEAAATRKANEEKREQLRIQREQNKAQKDSERQAKIDQKIAQQAANEYFNLGKALQDAELRYKNLALTQGFSNKQTQAALKEALSIRDVLDKVDQNLRNYQRNVGNYGSAFNGLGVSIQQILREAPSLAVSANTFFLAISNNLPILFDEINKIKEANKAAAAASEAAALAAREQATATALQAGATNAAAIAEGELAAQTVLANTASAKTPSLMQLIARNLFSLQSALTIGITVLTLYGAKIGNFFIELIKGKPAIDQFAEQQKRVSSAISESKDEFVKATLEVNNLKTAIDQAKRGVISKEEAVKLYNDTLGKTTGNVKSLEEAEKSLIEKGDAYIRFTLLKAAANTALSKSAELVFEAELNARRKIDQLQEDQKNNPIVNLDSLNQYDAYLVRIGEKDKAARRIRQRDAKNSEINSFKEIAEAFTKEAEEIAKKYNFDFNSINEGKSKTERDRQQKIADQTAQAILQEQFERQKIAIQRSAAANREIFENEQNSYEERLSALRLFIADQADLIEAERVFAVESEKLRIKEVIAALEEQKKEKGANIKAINDQEARERQLSAEKLLTIEARAKDGLIDLQTQLNAGLKRLRDERKSLREQEQKDAEKAGGSNIEILKGQADEEVKIEEEKNQKIKDARLKLYDELRSAFFQLLDDSITREVQYLDEQKRLLDESTQRRINQINLLGLNEVERTRQVAIVEKQAQFQTEQIEKRKRQLAVERARFQKFADIANIISATAQAVVAALADRSIPTTPARIALAGTVGAIGAVQLIRAIAAPLPRYKTGRGKGKEEFAITGDGGVNEYVVRSDGAIEKTPATPTLTYLGKDDMVLKDHSALVRHMIEAANPLGQIMAKKQMQQTDYMTDSTGKNIVKAIKSIDTNVKIIQHISTPVETTAYFLKAFR